MSIQIIDRPQLQVTCDKCHTICCATNVLDGESWQDIVKRLQPFIPKTKDDYSTAAWGGTTLSDSGGWLCDGCK